MRVCGYKSCPSFFSVIIRLFILILYAVYYSYTCTVTNLLMGFMFVFAILLSHFYVPS